MTIQKRQQNNIICCVYVSTMPRRSQNPVPTFCKLRSAYHNHTKTPAKTAQKPPGNRTKAGETFSIANENRVSLNRFRAGSEAGWAYVKPWCKKWPIREGCPAMRQRTASPACPVGSAAFHASRGQPYFFCPWGNIRGINPPILYRGEYFAVATVATKNTHYVLYKY